jgi:hypothetical protein
MRSPGTAILFLCAALPASAAEFRSELGGFSIDFPDAPKMAVQVLDVPGGKAPLVSYTVLSGKDELVAAYGDYPAGLASPEKLDQIYEGVAKGTAAATSGRVVEQGKAAVSGYRGISYRIAHEGPPRVSWSRSFLAGNRLFTITAAQPASDQSAERAKQFLDSFTIDAGAKAIFEAGLPGGSGGWREVDAGCLSGCSTIGSSASRCDRYCACYRKRLSQGRSEAEFSQVVGRISRKETTPAEKLLVEESQTSCRALVDGAP